MQTRNSVLLLAAILSALFAAACSTGDPSTSSGQADDDSSGPVSDDSADDDSADDDAVPDDTADDSDDDDADDTDVGDPITPTAGFTARCEEYLQNCFDHAGPGTGNVDGNICRLELGGAIDADAVRSQLQRAIDRVDCADFPMTSIMRMMYLYSDSEYFPQDLQDEIKAAFLGWKYWPDEKGADGGAIFWSENHTILYHSLELLAGQLWPGEVFPNADMTGQDHIDHAIPLLNGWLDMRGRIGFTEWHSNVYYNEDLPALFNLVDFAQDERIRTKAAMIIDLLAFDMALNSYKGYFATAHGRTYPDKVMGLGSDSLASTHHVWFGDGVSNSNSSFTTVAACTSPNYALPALLETIGSRNDGPFENRQRDSIDVADGPDYGLTWDKPEDVMFWWTMAAYAEWHVLPGTFQTIEDWDLWGGFYEPIAFLRFLVGSPVLGPLSKMLDPISRGPATETANLYTYRTPDYQLSSAQNYNPGLWAGQQHIVTSAIDKDATVFTSYPGGLSGDYMASDWVGGWLPKAGQYKNVEILLYDRPYIPILEDLLFKSYTHAYFPRSAFDEVVQSGAWTLGRKDSGYVALYSREPTAWSDNPATQDFELVANSRDNIWIIEMGSASENGSFEDFTDGILSAPIDVSGFNVAYDSPSVGLMTFGMNADLVVDGHTIDLGPYPRFDNEYCWRKWGDDPYVISDGARRLELRFDIPRRRYFED